MTTQDDEQQDQPTEMIPWDAPDGYLSILVETINTVDSDASLYLTLTVSSGVISGELVSGRRWWAELADQMQAASQQPAGEPGYASLFREQSEAYGERAARRGDGGDPEQVIHIHLRDAGSVAFRPLG